MAVAQVEHIQDRGSSASRRRDDATSRALAMWPRLDRRALTRCGGDPRRIARLVARRTSMDPEVIVMILADGEDLDRELWFG
jgi:hypothetical protein